MLRGAAALACLPAAGPLWEMRKSSVRDPVQSEEQHWSTHDPALMLHQHSGVQPWNPNPLPLACRWRTGSLSPVKVCSPAGPLQRMGLWPQVHRAVGSWGLRPSRRCAMAAADTAAAAWRVLAVGGRRLLRKRRHRRRKAVDRGLPRRRLLRLRRLLRCRPLPARIGCCRRRVVVRHMLLSTRRLSCCQWLERMLLQHPQQR